MVILARVTGWFDVRAQELPFARLLMLSGCIETMKGWVGLSTGKA